MSSKKIYYPQLDAIRGLSVLAVFFYHAYKPAGGQNLIQGFWLWLFSKMYLGLDVFFILSAFLLTLLGIREYQNKGNFSFKHYFLRRALRIWPLYYSILFFAFVILKIAQKYTGQQITLPPAGWYFFFISNYYLAGHVFFLRLLWTLSVEEQFYLIWGLCLRFFQKNLGWIIFILATGSLVFNIVGVFNDMDIYFNTVTYLLDMMAGAFVAFSITKNNSLETFFEVRGKAKSYLIYIFFPFLLAIAFLIDRSVSESFKSVTELSFRLIFILYCGLVIADQMVNGKTVIQLYNKKLLVYTGKISYGLYCFHGIVLTFAAFFFKNIRENLPGWLNAILMLAITFAIASLSYIVIEKPFLKLKDKLTRI